MIRFLGIEIQIVDRSGLGLESQILNAMSGFQTSASTTAEKVVLEVESKRPAEFPFGLRRVFRFRGIQAFGLGPRRACVYPDGTWVYIRPGRIQVGLESAEGAGSSEQLFEHIYKILQSVIGESLELRGYHRIHAVGFHSGKNVVLICADPGAGKSTLAYHAFVKPSLAEVPRCFQYDELLSEESPLLDSKGLQAHAFPLPIGRIDPDSGKKNRLVWKNSEKTNALKKEENWIVFAKKIRSHSKLKKISRIEGSLKLFPALVIGLGLVQLTEIFLRFTPELSLDRILLRRLVLWLKLSLSPRTRFHRLTD